MICENLDERAKGQGVQVVKYYKFIVFVLVILLLQNWGALKKTDSVVVVVSTDHSFKIWGGFQRENENCSSVLDGVGDVRRAATGLCY